MLATVLATLAKPVVISKLGLRNKEDNKSHIFKDLHSSTRFFKNN